MIFGLFLSLASIALAHPLGGFGEHYFGNENVEVNNKKQIAKKMAEQSEASLKISVKISQILVFGGELCFTFFASLRSTNSAKLKSRTER